MSLHAYLPQDRRRALAGGRALPEICRGAALFSDISGFTTLSEALTQGSGERRGVDELAHRINAVLEALIAEVERCGGSVIGFAGDGMTCWFDEDLGAGADAAARCALRCACAMQRAMRRFPELSVKVGVSCGAALRLAVGDPSIQRIDLLAGAMVARAIAAQSLAEAGEVLVDDAAAQALAPAALGACRQLASGEAFHPLLDPEAEPAFARDGPTGRAASEHASGPEPDLEALRTWVLPFVLQRETASGGLFATDLRPATALFLRVAQGIAPVPESGPAQAQALQATVEQAQRALQQHGGVLLEVAVDAFGVCLYGNFGAAQVHEDDAARALRAAMRLRQHFDDSGSAAQIGLSSGTLCVGGYGGATRRSFGAIGDEVNAAARLMAQARPGEILVSGRVRQLVATQDFAFEARAPIALKGKAEPMAVFAATGMQQRRAIRLQEPAAVLPMVGREAETRRLAAAFAAARAGRGQHVRIVAEAGMGKSRLVAEGLRIAAREGFIGYGGACRLDGIRTPYLVWQGIWPALFDLDPALPQRRQRQAAQAALQRHAPEQAEAWPLLGTVLDQDWPDTPFTAALQPKDRKSLLETVLLRCLQAAAAEAAEDGMGLLLVLEDLHAADPLSLELLAAAARAVETLPVLLLTTERPGDGGVTGAAPAARPTSSTQVQTIELGGLAAAEVEQIVRAKLALLFPQRTGSVPRELLERVAARAQGNPFYVEQLLDYLHDRGIDPRLPGAAQALEMPSSVHSLVLSRIDRLPVRQCNALKAASIIGREFTLADLHGYCPTLGSADAVAADLDQLDRSGFTPALPGAIEPCHVFRHPVTLEASYESIGLETRAQLHGQFARHLERRHPDALHLAPQLAHHYVRAGLRAEACRWLRLAGEQAAARFANEEALACFGKALAWLAAEDAAGRFDLLAQRQAVLDLQGRHDLQRQDIDELERLAPQLPDATARRARVSCLRAELEIGLGGYAAARASAQAALDLLDAVPTTDPALRVDALLLQTHVMHQTGEAAAARPLLERALALARTHGLRRAQCAALSSIGLVHWHLGESALAQRWLADALQLARDGDDLRMQLNTLNSLGVVAKSMSRFTESARHYEAAQQIAHRIGDHSGEAMLLNNLGSACLAGGRFHEAGRHCERAARMFAEAGETVLHGIALANRAEAHRELGQYERALALSEQALTLLRACGSLVGEALLLENLGLIEAASGRSADAQERLRGAVQIAREIRQPAREASALLHLGQIQCEGGALDAAGESLDRAEALARPLGDQSLMFELDAAQALLLARRASTAAALERLQHLLPCLLGSHSPDEPGLPMGLYAAALSVLRTCADPRAAALQALSRQELAERAAAIPDAAARRDFLDVAAHRSLQTG